jgi:hypothetical protein
VHVELLVIVAPVPTSRLAAIAAAAGAALAALLSFGALAFAGPSPSTLPAGARLAIVLLDAWHLAIAAIAGVAVLAVGWRSDRGPAAILIAISPLLLVLLPWLPFRVPQAFLIWTGGALSLVWIVTAAGLVRIAASRGDLAVGLSRPLRHPAFVPAVLSFVLFSAAAWFASPSIPGGDEPHYLVITQSLLYDHDLKIENNHQRGDYRAYFGGDLPPDFVKRGRNGAIYSIHAPGVPALVVPAFALGGYRGVVVFLLLVSAAACALAWWLAWRVTGSMAAAWFGWASIALAAPWLLETFTVYPDGRGAVVLLTGFWALLRAGWEKDAVDGTIDRPIRSTPLIWAAHGLALALLPWMHTRFSVLAATLGGLILVRLAHVPKAMAKAIAFLLPPAVSAVAWMFFFAVIYGAPDPSAPYGGRVDNSFAFLPNGLGGLLFDQGFGLVATAPVLVFACAGFTRIRRLAVEWLVVSLPYLLAVTTFAMWWAGSSGPARFLVPLLLPLAIPAACAWKWAAARSGGWRAIMIASLLVTAWLSAVMAGAGGGRLGYHTRNDGGLTAAPWMEWATHVVDLPSAAPAFVPLPIGSGLQARVTAARTGFTDVLPWAICLGGAAFAAAWWIDRRRLAGERASAVVTLSAAVSVMAASSIVWALHGTPQTRVAAQLDVLRMLASSRVAAFDLTGGHRLPRGAAWSLDLEISIPLRAGRSSARALNRPIAVFPDVPAGSYLLQVRRRGGQDGWVMAGVGNDQFAIVTEPIDRFDAGVPIRLPVDVRAINVRTDEGARDQLEGIVLRPVEMSRSRLSPGVARRAVRYDSLAAYFLDDRAFPEPSGFWVAGGRDTVVALAADAPRAAVTLTLRNGAAPNRVRLESGSWRGDVGFAAGEERRIAVPLDPSAGTALLRIQSDSGFRPTDIDGRSKDTRYLGVFVRFE